MSTDTPPPSAERRAADAAAAHRVLGCIRLGLDDPERRRTVQLFAFEKAMRDLLTDLDGRRD